MKKLLCVILPLILLLSLAACSTSEGSIKDPVHFYYCQLEMSYGTEPGVIDKEVRDAQGLRQDYAYLLSLYLKGPKSYSLYSPFPTNTSLKYLSLDNGTASIQLGSSFAVLTGLDLTLACACITMTVCEMTGAQQVTISAADALLDGNSSITMSPEDILLLDSSSIVIDPD